MAKPTILLVHGHWHSSKHFGPIIKDLESHGYKAVGLDFPSTQHSDGDFKVTNLTDDINVLDAAAKAELDAGNNVVVVAHSFGGIPTTSGLKGLDIKSRKAAGASTSVLAIVYLAGLILQPGQSFFEVIGSKPAWLHDVRQVHGGEFCWVDTPGPGWYFYNEQNVQNAKWASELLRPTSWAATKEKTTYAAYLDFPCYYLRCSKDNANMPFMQDMYLKGVEDGGGKPKIEEIASDHTPFIGKWMEWTSEYIRKIAEENGHDG